VVARVAGALMRVILVVLVVVTPALMLPASAADDPQLIVLIALLAAAFTFTEYCATSPAVVEFRAAPPVNRLRFVGLFTCVFLSSVICRGVEEPTVLAGAVTSAGAWFGNVVDIPLSPLWLVAVMLPEHAGSELVVTARAVAGVTLSVSVATVGAFLIAVRSGWPARRYPFNVWVNLPLFDPSAGGDVLDHLRRDARFNIRFGLILPFIIPPVVKLASFLVESLTLENPHTLIWTMTAWAFLPASTIMRGLALTRVADLIEVQRRRVATDRRAPDPQPA
jgi:predicted permease